MLSAASPAQAIAWRASRSRPPLGIPSRILCLRLRRAFHETPALSVSSPAAAVQEEPQPSRYPPPVRQPGPSPFSPVPAPTDRFPLGEGVAQFPPIVELLRSVQAQDVHAILRWLSVHIGGPHDDAGGTPTLALEVLSALPQTTFSEVVRSVDPLRVGHLLDYSDGMLLSNALQQFSTAAPVDQFGIRKVYTRLLLQLRRIFRCRMAAGNKFAPSDFVVMMRCCGAAGRPRWAKALWNLMDETERLDWRQADVYNEFVRARFLLEPLYAHYNIERFRVRPLHLQREKANLSLRKRAQLNSLKLSMRSKKRDDAGMDPEDVNGAQDLSYLLRGKRPVLRAFSYMANRGIMDERILCAALIAYGRTASLVAMKVTLTTVLGIRIAIDRSSGAIQIRGKRKLYSDSSLRPTEKLLDAIVEGFCSNAEVRLAYKLVHYVSRQYGIPIPHETWSKLLEWTYVCASEPCSLEWRVMGANAKLSHPRDVIALFETMTSAPYNLQPTFEDRNVCIKALLAMANVERWSAGEWIAEIVSQMRVVKAHYAQLQAEYEDAVFREILASRQGVLVAEARHAKERARLRMHVVWADIQRLCQRLLKVVFVNPNMRHEMPTVMVPNLVREFAEFMPDPARYRVLGGIVQLHLPATSFPRFEWQKEQITSPRTLHQVPAWEKDAEGSLKLDERGQRVPTGIKHMVVQTKRVKTVRMPKQLKKLKWQAPGGGPVETKMVQQELIW